MDRNSPDRSLPRDEEGGRLWILRWSQDWLEYGDPGSSQVTRQNRRKHKKNVMYRIVKIYYKDSDLIEYAIQKKKRFLLIGPKRWQYYCGMDQLPEFTLLFPCLAECFGSLEAAEKEIKNLKGLEVDHVEVIKDA